MIKDKINEVAVTAAIGLASLQVITPMFVDAIFDGMIICLMYIAAKVTK